MPHRNMAVNSTAVTVKVEHDELGWILDAVQFVYPDKPDLIDYLANRLASAAKHAARKRST